MSKDVCELSERAHSFNNILSFNGTQRDSTLYYLEEFMFDVSAFKDCFINDISNINLIKLYLKKNGLSLAESLLLSNGLGFADNDTLTNLTENYTLTKTVSISIKKRQASN